MQHLVDVGANDLLDSRRLLDGVQDLDRPWCCKRRCSSSGSAGLWKLQLESLDFGSLFPQQALCFDKLLALGDVEFIGSIELQLDFGRRATFLATSWSRARCFLILSVSSSFRLRFAAATFCCMVSVFGSASLPPTARTGRGGATSGLALTRASRKLAAGPFPQAA